MICTEVNTYTQIIEIRTRTNVAEYSYLVINLEVTSFCIFKISEKNSNVCVHSIDCLLQLSLKITYNSNPITLRIEPITTTLQAISLAAI